MEAVNSLWSDYANILILVLPLFPMAGGFLLFFLKSRMVVREALAVAISLLTFIGVLLLFPVVSVRSPELFLEGFIHMGLYFRLDFLSWVFSFLISGIWFLATVFSLTYMSFEHALRRYYSILIFTLGATLGVVMSGDFFTLFLFFELMTLSSYVLVIHEQEEDAMAAGHLYLYLGIAGGLALLMGVFMLFAVTGSYAMIPLLGELGTYRLPVFIMFLIGFGIKAGVVPLHIWLPRAHPVAPSPASALLSGLMIKAGAYGIMRVALVVYTPGEVVDPAGEVFAAYLGHFLLWLGIVTMFLGAFMALLQNNAKRILAYSSVSQMGYIIMGVGAAGAFMEYTVGAMGFSGAVYHLFNHAFFKAALFMIIGSVFMYTRELRLDHLGGMLRKMPVSGVCFLVAAFGIAGIPGFNGYPSKTLLHDALLYAVKDTGMFSVAVAEKIFVITSALTVCYFTKLFRGVFLGPVPEKFDRDYPATGPVKISLGLFAGVIVLTGLFPTMILNRIILPAMAPVPLNPEKVQYLFGFNFFQWVLIKEMVVVLVLAGIIYYAGMRWQLFDRRFPHWLSVEYSVYRPVLNLVFSLMTSCGFTVDRSVNSFYQGCGQAARGACGYVVSVDTAVDDIYELTGRGAKGLTDRCAYMDEALNEAYDKTGKACQGMVDTTCKMDETLDKIYEKAGQTGTGLVKSSQRLDESLDQACEKTGMAARDFLVNRPAEGDNGMAAHGAVNGAPDGGENQGESRSRAELPGPGPGKKSIFQELFSGWDIKNLNFDSFLLVVVLGIVLFVLFFYGLS